MNVIQQSAMRCDNEQSLNTVMFIIQKPYICICDYNPFIHNFVVSTLKNVKKK